MRRRNSRTQLRMASKDICCKGGGGGGGGKGGGGGGGAKGGGGGAAKQKTAKKTKTKSPNGSVAQRRNAAKAAGIKGVGKLNSQKLADLGF